MRRKRLKTNCLNTVEKRTYFQWKGVIATAIMGIEREKIENKLSEYGWENDVFSVKGCNCHSYYVSSISRKPRAHLFMDWNEKLLYLLSRLFFTRRKPTTWLANKFLQLMFLQDIMICQCIADQLFPTDKSWYFARICPIIVNFVFEIEAYLHWFSPAAWAAVSCSSDAKMAPSISQSRSAS